MTFEEAKSIYEKDGGKPVIFCELERAFLFEDECNGDTIEDGPWAVIKATGECVPAFSYFASLKVEDPFVKPWQDFEGNIIEDEAE